MRYLALCCDYDGTLARHGRVDEPTLAALERLRKSGRRLVLVTGRELDDLKRVFPPLELFDRIVAENGALIYRPATREERLLGEAPPASFVDKLVARGVQPLSVGRVIVATWEPHEKAVLETIRECGLELQLIFNKGAVMVLPAGVNKAVGLEAALSELNLSPHNAVGIGDAENDHAFLGICECSVAVANALPSVKEKADITTFADHGAGVIQLIDELLADDLASRESLLTRHDIVLGRTERGELVGLSPYSVSALIAGTSGGGKSTVAAGLVERLRAKEYSFCIIDPEGDYDSLDSTIVLGDPGHAPSLEACEQLLAQRDENAVINLLGLKFDDRPRFFMSLFSRIRDLRSRTGRPHWLIVDEAHHVLPADWQPADSTLPDGLQGVVMVTVSPGLIARPVLRAIDTLIVLGEEPARMYREFTDANRLPAIEMPAEALPSGTALVWSKASRADPVQVRIEPGKLERRRHLRKYAEGALPEDRSFYFRGPEEKLNLRAHNLIQFMELADGVDDGTWLHHLRQGEVSQWLRNAIKDESLAERVAAIERNDSLDPTVSRRKIRELIEASYTLPANQA
ncbi:MAG TPA: HAD-IIB family hydrolase [Steroidobacteraceae bacterium]